MSRHPSYPFVRCLLAWEDAWGNPPVPTDRWHWCALAPDHDGSHACTCGAARTGEVSVTVMGARSFRMPKARIVA